jgi:hypothetical protein
MIIKYENHITICNQYFDEYLCNIIHENINQIYVSTKVLFINNNIETCFYLCINEKNNNKW